MSVIDCCSLFVSVWPCGKLGVLNIKDGWMLLGLNSCQSVSVSHFDLLTFVWCSFHY